jgi:hypothetical protein
MWRNKTTHSAYDDLYFIPNLALYRNAIVQNVCKTVMKTRAAAAERGFWVQIRIVI